LFVVIYVIIYFVVAIMMHLRLYSIEWQDGY
jgi:hypothetical protein